MITHIKSRWMADPSPDWVPYFGNQARFAPFVQELLIGLGAKPFAFRDHSVSRTTDEDLEVRRRERLRQVIPGTGLK